jgi:hypothetical protein
MLTTLLSLLVADADITDESLDNVARMPLNRCMHATNKLATAALTTRALYINYTLL